MNGPLSGAVCYPDPMRRPANSTVLKYLRRLAAGMGLASWELRIDPTTPEQEGIPDAHAAIGVNPEKAYASVSLAPSLFELAPAEQRQALVHELVHIILAPLGWSHDDLTAGLSKRAKGLADATWAQRSERACDDLACLIAHGLPLPPWRI